MLAARVVVDGSHQLTSVSSTWLRMSSTAESVEADRKLALQKPQCRPDALAACHSCDTPCAFVSHAEPGQAQAYKRRTL